MEGVRTSILVFWERYDVYERLRTARMFWLFFGWASIIFVASDLTAFKYLGVIGFLVWFIIILSAMDEDD